MKWIFLSLAFVVGACAAISAMDYFVFRWALASEHPAMAGTTLLMGGLGASLCVASLWRLVRASNRRRPALLPALGMLLGAWCLWLVLENPQADGKSSRENPTARKAQAANTVGGREQEDRR
jgi:hypothetical protein